MCAWMTLGQKTQGAFHLSGVAQSASFLGFVYELFFWLGIAYQKFCSISFQAHSWDICQIVSVILLWFLIESW